MKHYDTTELDALRARKAPLDLDGACFRHIGHRLVDQIADFLDALPVGQARQWLLSLEGVGAKTAACVLLFSLGKPVIPVDTHVHRLARRLGLVEARATPEKTEEILESLVLPEARYAFHMNLIAHGRRVCKAQSPRCEECVLACACAFAAGRSTNAVAR